MADVDHAARFVGGCYTAFPCFDQFTAYSMLYFVAASFSEMARRVDTPDRPRRFLCADHPLFGEATLRLSPALSANGPGYQAAITAAAEPLNIAGLSDPAKRNWYGIDLEDAIRGAAKLGVSPARISEYVAHV